MPVRREQHYSPLSWSWACGREDDDDGEEDDDEDDVKEASPSCQRRMVALSPVYATPADLDQDEPLYEVVCEDRRTPRTATQGRGMTAGPSCQQPPPLPVRKPLAERSNLNLQQDRQKRVGGAKKGGLLVRRMTMMPFLAAAAKTKSDGGGNNNKIRERKSRRDEFERSSTAKMGNMGGAKSKHPCTQL